MNKLSYTWPWIRIDKRLSNQLPYSRSFFSHLFERGAVRILEKIATQTPPSFGHLPLTGEKTDWLSLGRLIKKSYKLKDGDEVIIDNLERFVDGGILDECPAWDIEVRLEKEDYMVIYKPKGVLSHPNSVRDVQHPSVVWWVYHYIKNKATSWSWALPTSGSFIRAGLVHRLDKETDGCMIIAKTEKWLAYFKDLFQQKSLCETIQEKENVPLKKHYVATCEVTPGGQSFLEKISWQLPFIIQEDVIPKVPHPVVKEGITKVVSVKHRVATHDKVEVQLEILTWRTHQIRYHLSTHWLPIVGDYVYGKEDASGMQLTARKLEFIDCYGKEIVCEA